MLKKFGIAALAASILVASVAGIVFAQDVAPPPDCPCGEPRNGEPLAEILGISVEELRETIADGKTITELAEAKGMSMEDVALALGDHYTDCIQQAVADGNITQEQADQWLENMQERLEYRLKNGFSGGFRKGGHSRFEGHDGRFGSLAEIFGYQSRGDRGSACRW